MLGSGQPSLLVLLVVPRPAADGLFPLLGQLRQDVDAGPYVAAPLGVMGGQGEHAGRPPLGGLHHGPVKVGHRIAHVRWVAAHLVEGAERVVPVERGVLHPFGHHRRAQLGEAHREARIRAHRDTRA